MRWKFARRYGFEARIGNVLLHRGPVLFDLGDEARELADLQRGIALWRRASGIFMLARNMTLLADYQLRANQLEQARASLAEAERHAETTEENDQFAEIFRLRGRIWQSEGNYEQARLCFECAIVRSRKQRARLFELHAARDLARLSLEVGGVAHLLKRLRAVVDWFPAGLDIPGARRMSRTAAVVGLHLEGFEILLMFPVRDVALETADCVTADGHVVVDEFAA